MMSLFILLSFLACLTLALKTLALLHLFRLCNKKSTTSPEVFARKLQGETNVLNSSSEAPGQQQTQQAFQGETLKPDPKSDRAPGRNWWTNTSSKPQLDLFQPSVRDWDFSCIFFPDLGSYCAKYACLPPPDPSLLPGALQVPECHMAHWHRNINLRQQHQSKQKQQREQNRQRCNINDDQRLCRCSNWVEYSELMEKRKNQQPHEKPTHLGEEDVMPLAHPRKCRSHRKC